MNSSQLLFRYKYEVLLLALVQHLFIGIFMTDLGLYRDLVWPLNMLLLGLASAGIFRNRGRGLNLVRNVLFLAVLALPLGLSSLGQLPYYFQVLNAVYVVFFGFIFLEILRFMVRPGYINADVISASACGYLLLVEIGVFLFQYCFYARPGSFKGIDTTTHSTIFIDLVYFCSVTLTSIGFGDVLPSAHFTKLLVAAYGIAGQFYTVMLVGTLISKFSSLSTPR